MSVSLNRVENHEECFVKYYGEKKPLWKYYLRSFLDSIGISQPVEYYEVNKRLEFELNTLKLWKNYKLNVPVVIKREDKKLVLEKIQGDTLDALLDNKDKIDSILVEKLFTELNDRHKLAMEENEPKLCHIDSNLRNIIYTNGKIFHIDFEMGREKESIDMWMEREVSKLLVSLLQHQSVGNRNIILDYFCKLYHHKSIISSIIKKKLKRNRQDNKEESYKLFNVAFDLNKRGIFS